MSEEKKQTKKPFQNLFNKIKKIKHLDIILTVLFIAIILLIYFSSFSFTQTKENSNSNSNTQQGQASTTFEEYVLSLTNQIENIVSSIKGAGNTKVMLYFEEGIKTEIAYSTETKTLSDGTKVEVKSPVLVTKNGQDEPIVLQETMPKPVSIIIVANGAENTNVKLEILRLVQAMFEIGSSKVEIFAGN